MGELREFIIANPILAATLSSLWGAIVIDLVTFAKAKEPGDFFGQWSVKLALWRYLQATVSGFIGNVVVASGSAAVTGLIIWAVWR